MRHLSAAIAFLLIAHSASALKYSEALGNWPGNLTEKNPSGTYSLKMVVRIVPFGESGLAIRKKISNAYGNVFVEASHLNSMGIVAQQTTVSGHVFSEGPGRWNSGAHSITVKVKLTYYYGEVFQQTTTMTFHNNRLVYRTTNNSGLLQTGTLKRK